MQQLIKLIAISAIVAASPTSCSVGNTQSPSSQINWPTRYDGPAFATSTGVYDGIRVQEGRIESLTAGPTPMMTIALQTEIDGGNPIGPGYRNYRTPVTLTLSNPPRFAVELHALGKHDVLLYTNQNEKPMALAWVAGVTQVNYTSTGTTNRTYEAKSVAVDGRRLSLSPNLPLWAEDRHNGIHPLVLSNFPSLALPDFVRSEFGGRSKLEPVWAYGYHQTPDSVATRLNDGGLDLITIKESERDFLSAARMAYVIRPDLSDGLVHEYHTYPY